MSNKKDLNEFVLFESLKKYLTTSIETSRGVVKITEKEQVPLGMRKPPDRIVEYDCHDIRVTVSNTAPTEPEFPAVVFTGLALFVDLKENEDKISGRWHQNNMPMMNLQNAPQTRDKRGITQSNQFPCTNGPYFPNITDDERSHGYYLLPGQHIIYEMNVLLDECLDLNDMKLWVEGTVSRRHLFHFAKEVTL